MKISLKMFFVALLAVTLPLINCNRNDFSYGDMNQGQNNIQNQPYQWTEQNKEIALIIGVVYFIAICVGVFINCFLLYKCYKKRRASRILKQQMAIKKMEFASSIGMNVYQLNNDQRIGGTLHV